MLQQAALFVLGEYQGKAYAWPDIEDNILWSGEKAPEDCKLQCDTNEECTAWQTCNFGMSGPGCSGCYLINKQGKVIWL